MCVCIGNAEVLILYLSIYVGNAEEVAEQVALDRGVHIHTHHTRRSHLTTRVVLDSSYVCTSKARKERERHHDTCGLRLVIRRTAHARKRIRTQTHTHTHTPESS